MNQSHGIKQSNLTPSHGGLDGKQILPADAHFYATIPDGAGGFTMQAASPVFRHEVRPTGEFMRLTGAPVMQVVSIDTLKGRETHWPNGRGLTA